MSENKHKELLTAYHSWLGYDPAWPKERVGAKRILAAGHSIEDVKECYEHYKSKRFWADKHLSLTYIAQNIGAFMRDRKPSEVDLDKWYNENN